MSYGKYKYRHHDVSRDTIESSVGENISRKYLWVSRTSRIVWVEPNRSPRPHNKNTARIDFQDVLNLYY